MGAGCVLCDMMTFYVDACALVYFQFHPQSVGRSVDPGTMSRHFGAETKIISAEHWSSSCQVCWTCSVSIAPTDNKERIADHLTLLHTCIYSKGR